MRKDLNVISKIYHAGIGKSVYPGFLTTKYFFSYTGDRLKDRNGELLLPKTIDNGSEKRGTGNLF